MLVEVMQVKQLDVQGVQTEETETYPEGQVVRQVLLGLREYDEMQEMQKVSLVQLWHWFRQLKQVLLLPKKVFGHVETQVEPERK